MGKRRNASRKAAERAPFEQNAPFWHCFLLALATILVYGSLASHPFLNYDDDGYIVKNAHVQAGLSWRTLGWALTTADMANWHPVTWLSHALDVQIFGNWAGGHHLVSLALHAVNAILLYLLLARATGFAERSLFVAALFALHPINVESVAWMAERKNLLSTFFFLLALGAYGAYARKPSRQRYFLVAGWFALGLASKPMLVTFPFVLLLVDFWPLGRLRNGTTPSGARLSPQQPWQALVMEKLPLLALSAASSAITVIAQRGTALSALGELPLGTRIQNAIFSYSMYVWKVFWPVDLAPIYPHPGNTLAAYQILFALLFLASVSAWAWHFRRERPYLLTGWFWFLGTLVPVIGIVQVGAQAMADRYAYLPLIGIFVMCVWGAAEFAAARNLLTAFRVSAVLVAGILAMLTWRQLQYWKTPVDLWSHTLSATKNNYIAEDNLASALLRAGNLEAVRHFENASRIAPRDPVSHAALAGYFQDQGRFLEAISYYQVAIHNQADPEMLSIAEANLAIIYRQTGDYEKARETYRLAARSSPEALDEMMRGLSQQLTSQPAAEGYLRLGLLFDVANRVAEARAAYEQALRLEPAFEDARKALATLQ